MRFPESELAILAPFRHTQPTPSPEVQPGYYEAKWAVEKEAKSAKELYADEKKAPIPHYEYMQTAEWQVREERLEIDGYTCMMCGSGKNLQVHHINYQRLGLPGQINDLRTLCKNCHDKVHAYDNKIRHCKEEREEENDEYEWYG